MYKPQRRFHVRFFVVCLAWNMLAVPGLHLGRSLLLLFFFVDMLLLGLLLSFPSCSITEDFTENLWLKISEEYRNHYVPML